MNHRELAAKVARDLMTGSDDGVLGARLNLFDGEGLYMGGWSLDGITDRIEQHLADHIDDLERPHIGTYHPTHEWIRLAADLGRRPGG
jgi:hypothetical protein